MANIRKEDVSFTEIEKEENIFDVTINCNFACIVRVSHIKKLGCEHGSLKIRYDDEEISNDGLEFIIRKTLMLLNDSLEAIEIVKAENIQRPSPPHPQPKNKHPHHKARIVVIVNDGFWR